MRQNHDIKALPDFIINQIAAGEVVDGPASIVKELVENSLDAGSTDICVNLSSGGLDNIEVADNGCGIRKNDLEAAITRHYTSKLDETSEVLKIVSLGFRGEALASITSVAEVELTSRHQVEVHPWLLSIKPGQVTSIPKPAVGNVGTRISVTNLFGNVPARRAFLKQPRTEFFKIKVLMRQFAFTFPGVRFRLNQKGLKGLNLNPARTFELSDSRWRTLFGAKLIESLVPINTKFFGGGVNGWISNESFPSSRSDRQCLAINGRIVRDKIVQHAVRSAYGESLPRGEHAFYALSITIPDANIDVNVHPAKLEVRIRNSRELHDLVYVSVSDALSRTETGVANYDDVKSPFVSATDINYRGNLSNDRQHPTVTSPERPLVVVDNRYLIFVVNSDLRLLDLDVVWRAVLAKQFLCNHNDGVGQSVDLLVPERVSIEDFKIIMPYIQELQRIGFTIEGLGMAGALVRKVPKAFPKTEICYLLNSFYEHLRANNSLQDSLLAAILASFECESKGDLSQRMFDEMTRSAQTLGIDINSFGVSLDSEFLQRGLRK